MGNCIYCGQKAGIFKDHHKECLEDYKAGKIQLVNAVADGITHGQDLNELSTFIDSIAKNCHIKDSEKQELMFEGYDVAVSIANDDNVISSEEESRLVIFQKHFNYTQDQLNKKHSYDLLCKGAIVRSLAEGKIRELSIPEGYALPIVLTKDEKIIWAFANSILYQPSFKTTYQGTSQGISFRVVKGLYYRMGAFKGNPITTTEMKFIASGITFYTTKNVFFSSPEKTVKIPFDKIISINQFSDGVSIQKDGSSAKPFILSNVDGAFLQNIIANVHF